MPKRSDTPDRGIPACGLPGGLPGDAWCAEALMRTLDEHAIISITDARGTITHVNDQFCRISGYSRAELVGRNHRLINSGLHPRVFWTGMWRTISSGASWRQEVCNRAKDGSLYWVDSIIAPVEAGIGHARRYVSIRYAITSRKQFANSLHEQQELLSLATTRNKIGLWDYDIVAGTLNWDNTMFELYGRPREQNPRAYQTWRESLHPEDLDRAEGELNEAIAGGKPFETDFRVRYPNGEVHHIRARAAVLRDPDGKPRRMLGTNYDVTDFRQAQEDMARATAQKDEVLRTLDAARDCILITDPESLRFVYANAGASAQLGYSREEILHLTPLDIKPGFNADTYRALLEETRACPTRTRILRTEHLRRDGSRVPVEVCLQFPPGGAGRFIQIARDISETLRLQQELEGRNRELEQFVLCASHDLKSPLVTILGYISHLISDIEEGDTATELDYARRIKRAADRMRVSVDDLLKYGRVGSTVYKLESIDLAQLVEQIGELLAAKIAQAGASLAVEVPPEPVRFDRELITHVLQNLIENAAQYGCTRDDRTINVSATVDDGGVIELKAADHGAGIPAQHRERVFGLFQRLSADRKGTGVGLAIVRRIAQLGGGFAAVEDTPGGGATFRVRLAPPECQLCTGTTQRSAERIDSDAQQPAAAHSVD